MQFYSVEKIITVAILCVWFAFPMGMLISFMIQSRHQKYPKITLAPTKKKHQPEYHKIFTVNDVDDEGEYHEREVDIPIIPAHQIPKKPGHAPHTNWRT